MDPQRSEKLARKVHARRQGKHDFWNSRVNLIKNYVFEIRGSRAIDWYMYGV